MLTSFSTQEVTIEEPATTPRWGTTEPDWSKSKSATVTGSWWALKASDALAALGTPGEVRRVLLDPGVPITPRARLHFADDPPVGHPDRRGWVLLARPERVVSPTGALSHTALTVHQIRGARP